MSSKYCTKRTIPQGFREQILTGFVGSYLKSNYFDDHEYKGDKKIEDIKNNNEIINQNNDNSSINQNKEVNASK